MKSLSSRTCVALVLLGLLGAASPGLLPPVSAAEPAPKKATAQYEIRFMTGMIEHHMMAVMAAELCETRAVTPELLALCDQIKTTQMAEIETMQGWLQDWYGISYEPEMSPGMTRQMEQLAALSGAAFEIEFMKRMIRHHWGAIIEARQCERRVYHAELRELCRDIAAAQAEEITTMQGWLCSWYGVCNYGPKGSHLRH